MVYFVFVWGFASCILCFGCGLLLVLLARSIYVCVLLLVMLLLSVFDSICGWVLLLLIVFVCVFGCLLIVFTVSVYVALVVCCLYACFCLRLLLITLWVFVGY